MIIDTDQLQWRKSYSDALLVKVVYDTVKSCSQNRCKAKVNKYKGTVHFKMLTIRWHSTCGAQSYEINTFKKFNFQQV